MITSIHNARVVRAARLKVRAGRERDRRFLVEGAQAVLEALRRPDTVVEVFLAARPTGQTEAVGERAAAAGVPAHVVSEEVMRHLANTISPQGIVAVAGFLDVDLDDALRGGVVPILAEVRDPGNAGTILRSADAAGAAAVVITRASVDIYNPKTVRATAGSLFHLPVAREVDAMDAIAEARSRGFQVLAADAAGRRSVHDVDLTVPTAIVLGNEARGLPEGATQLADQVVRVPIRGPAESLNLAAAATVFLFEAARQREAPEADDASLARIVDGAAHDIRSPLTALKGFSATLLSRWDRLSEDERRMMLEGLGHDAARLEVVVSQLVDAARARTHSLRVDLQRVELVEAVRSVADELSSWGVGQFEVSGSPVMALAAPATLRAVDNAMAEAPPWGGEAGPVRLRVESGPRPRIHVRRAGSSLDAGAAADLFTPRTAGTGRGSKVGLYVARSIARAHGGSLEPDIRRGIGFVLELPGG